MSRGTLRTWYYNITIIGGQSRDTAEGVSLERRCVHGDGGFCLFQRFGRRHQRGCSPGLQLCHQQPARSSSSVGMVPSSREHFARVPMMYTVIHPFF